MFDANKVSYQALLLSLAIIKNITRIFSVQNRQKNRNIQPGSEKQYSHKKERVYRRADIRVHSVKKGTLSDASRQR